MRRLRGVTVLGLSTVLACAIGLAAAVPASAAGSVYGTWTVSGSGGSVSVPATGFPSASGNRPSTTVITFAAPTPAAGWSFTLGDIDADSVRIEATTAAGAAGWFRPAVPLKTLTFVFSVQSGNPIYHLWFASLTKAIGGTLRGECDGQQAAGTLRLLNPDGTPVPGAQTTADGAGRYTFPDVAPGSYQVRVTPIDGMTVTSANPRDVDITSDDAQDVDFTLACQPPPPTPPTTPGNPPNSSAMAAPHLSAGKPLASTGSDLRQWIMPGVLLTALGSWLLYATRRRSGRAE